MSVEGNWKCRRCGEALELKKTVFDYLGNTFSENILCCPRCGEPLIPPELARDRMAEVEQMLEDK